MRQLIAMTLAASALTLAGCATYSETQSRRQAAAESALAKALEGRTAGKTQSCLANFGVTGPQIIDSKTLLYRDGRTIWRNDLPEECPGMQPDDLLVVEIFGSQLCENDRFRANPRGSVVPGVSCRIGKFTAYTK